MLNTRYVAKMSEKLISNSYNTFPVDFKTFPMSVCYRNLIGDFGGQNEPTLNFTHFLRCLHISLLVVMHIIAKLKRDEKQSSVRCSIY